MSESVQRGAEIRLDGAEPLWIQAAGVIRQRISSGALPPGSRLAPERDLCQDMNISRVTLRKALNHLVTEGLLQPSHGRGWYVADSAVRKEWPNSLESFSETAARMGLSSLSDVIRAEEAFATLDQAEELGIAPGTKIFHLERVRRLGGVPIALDVTRIASALVPDFAKHDFTTASLYEKLAEAGVEPVRADSTIESSEADPYTADYLELAVGKPLLVMHQVAVDAADRPLFATTIKYVGDRYRLRTSFTRPGR